MTIVAYFVIAGGWLIAGCLTVALCVALGINDLVKGTTNDTANEACTLLFWPLALVIALVILLGKAGTRLGNLAKRC